MPSFYITHDSLLDELHFLRKGTGFTPLRAYDLLVLPDLLGGRGQPFQESKDRFMKAIYALPSDQLRDSLLVAYALQDGFTDLPTIRARRFKYSTQVHRRSDTLQHWEDIAIEHLANLLLNSSGQDS
jgi:hypothetical protein